MSAESGPTSKGIGPMRAIMQGLTDAEFERLYGTEEQCLAASPAVVGEAGTVLANGRFESAEQLVPANSIIPLRL